MSWEKLSETHLNGLTPHRNPYLGKPLGNKFGIDLTGFYKLYFAKKKYRIVYRRIGEHIEVIEIIGIGKRDKEEIYKIVAKRLKKLKA